MHQAARIPVVTNGNVTLSTASPVADSKAELHHALDLEPEAASGADAWGPGPREASLSQAVLGLCSGFSVVP